MAFGRMKLLFYSCSRTQVDLKFNVLVILHLAAPPWPHPFFWPCSVAWELIPMECFTQALLPCGFCFWLYEIVEGEEMEGKSACGLFSLVLFLPQGLHSRTFQLDVSGVQGSTME